MRLRTSKAHECGVCGNQKAYSATQGLGWLCSKECFEKARDTRRAHHNKTRELATEDFPEEFQLSDFERYVLRLALYHEDNHLDYLKESQIWSLEDLVEDLKGRVLQYIPSKYVKLTEARGHARLFTGGTYEVLKPIPKSIVVGVLGTITRPTDLEEFMEKIQGE